jgi:hypothetical protein
MRLRQMFSGVPIDEVEIFYEISDSFGYVYDKKVKEVK